MATYIRLTDYKDSDSKEQGFFKSKNRYEAKQDDFEKIPGSPIAYWSSERVRNFFTNNKLKNISEIKNGLGTTNNDLFVREWVEVNLKKIGFNYMNRILACESKKRWFPYNKGGETRKWYGNMSLIVDWEGDGKRIRKATEGASQNFHILFFG